MKHRGIYKIYWDNNTYYYIGQSIDIDARYKKHLRLLKKNKHENYRIQNIYNKYGIPNICILELSDDNLDIIEQSYIDIHFNNKDCCNLSPSASTTKGYKHSEETKKLIGELSKKKIYTEEYRAKLRSRKPNITFLGKKHSEETRKLMSLKAKGKIKSAEHLRKIGDAHKGGKSYMAKPVINVFTNKIYPSIKDLSIEENIKYFALQYRLRKNVDDTYQYYKKPPI